MRVDREVQTLGDPPPPERLRRFPVWYFHAGTVLCRVTTAGNGPWWFASGTGRFDLAPPRGTCYLADDEIASLLEVLGPTAVVASRWVASLHVWHVPLPAQCSAADTTVRAARGFGVTAELATVTPYDLPQRWAAAFAASGYEGIRYRVRHDPGGARALALFGAAGERRRWRRGRGRPVDDNLLARFTEQTGVQVAPVPDSADLGELLE